jgi:hypothetical protein
MKIMLLYLLLENPSGFWIFVLNIGEVSKKFAYLICLPVIIVEIFNLQF